MNILTVENKVYKVDEFADVIDDCRFCVLDLSNKQYVDYYFTPLVFLELFQSPAAVLTVGEYKIKVPLDWSILLCDEEMQEVSLEPITSMPGKGFSAFTFNPLSSFIPTPRASEVSNVYKEVDWCVPKTDPGKLLAVPLSFKPGSPCVFIVKSGVKVVKNIELSELYV